jgi:hypothetical protein
LSRIKVFFRVMRQKARKTLWAEGRDPEENLIEGTSACSRTKGKHTSLMGKVIWSNSNDKSQFRKVRTFAQSKKKKVIH